MSINGTANDDVLNGTNRADTMEGGAGNDILNSGAGNDVIYGGIGDDKLHAGDGDDALEGGAGNDQLAGGGGSDIFVFRFGVSSGGTIREPVTFPGFDPGPDGFLNLEEFGDQYRAWLKLVGIDGPDANAIVDTVWNSGNPLDPVTFLEGAIVNDSTIESVSVTTQEGTRIRFYENTIYRETTTLAGVTQSDGHDTIVSFQQAGPNNVDQIQLHGLAGLSDATLDALFDLQLVDSDNDGQSDASKLVWNGGSIVIGGRTDWGTDVLSFLYDEQVHLL